uniref:AXH domain-containing protein n=1 Tax=Corethrella appendiculata TaxID=1370023 RepID=U5EQ37_9DIPT
MLSAVESLLPGRIYSHPYAGPTAATTSLLNQLPTASLPLLNSSFNEMSVAEFARPHPKQRYNDALLRNGLSVRSASSSSVSAQSSGTKYSDQQQNGPVNLAVSSNTSSIESTHLHHNHQPHTAKSALEYQQEQQKQLVESDIGKLYSSNSRLSSFYSSPAAIDTNNYQALNFSLYGNPYGYPPPTHLDNRLLQRTYLSTQREPYNPTYLPSALTYSQSLNNNDSSNNFNLNGNSRNGGDEASLTNGKSKLLLSPPVPTGPMHQHHPHSNLVEKSPNKLHENDIKAPPIMNAIFPHGERTYLNGAKTTHSIESFIKEKENSKLDKPSMLHHPHSIYHPHHHHPHHHHQQQQQQQQHLSSNSLPSHHLKLEQLHNQHQQQQQHQHLQHQQQQHQSQIDRNNVGFKIPSGKEGSLKHRILTRPSYGDKDSRRKNSITNKISTVFKTSDNGTTTNFTKGSLIELANGEYRRVEDVRTEDFVLLAEKSAELQLTESTTVKITINRHNNSNVIITFSHENNRSRTDIEASIEHPFFVYGQGWASCNPEKTLQLFGLKCQRLQVGDICLSLRPRERKLQRHSTPNTSSIASPSSSTASVFTTPHEQQAHLQLDKTSKELLLQNLPQNLSRRSTSHTILTTATSTAVSSRATAPQPQPTHLNLPPSLPPFAIPNFSSPNLSLSSLYSNLSVNSKHLSPSLTSTPSSASTAPPASIAPSAPNCSNDNDQPVSMIIDKNSKNSTTNDEDEDHVIDASLSRKRRWSAPDNIFDEEQPNNKNFIK